MSTPFIRIEEKELGLSENGEKLTMLGQVYGYENCNGIAVVKVSGQKELVFLEINATKNSVNQIFEPEDIENLNELWKTTEAVDLVAEKLGLNSQ